MSIAKIVAALVERGEEELAEELVAELATSGARVTRLVDFNKIEDAPHFWGYTPRGLSKLTDVKLPPLKTVGDMLAFLNEAAKVWIKTPQGELSNRAWERYKGTLKRDKLLESIPPLMHRLWTKFDDESKVAREVKSAGWDDQATKLFVKHWKALKNNNAEYSAAINELARELGL
jgi:hypothetical protein